VQIHEIKRPLDLPALAVRLAPLGDVRVYARYIGG